MTPLGESGTVLNGARQLTGWAQAGSYWYASGQTQEGARIGECQTGYPRCAFPEQLFINGELLQAVSSLGEVGPPNLGREARRLVFRLRRRPHLHPLQPLGADD